MQRRCRRASWLTAVSAWGRGPSVAANSMGGPPGGLSLWHGSLRLRGAPGVGYSPARYTTCDRDSGHARRRQRPKDQTHPMKAQLVVLESGDPAETGKVYPLDGKATYTLGRGHQADIPVMDIKCSREHCRVEKRADGFWLVDLGSTNGTKVNGKRVKKKSEQL